MAQSASDATAPQPLSAPTEDADLGPARTAIARRLLVMRVEGASIVPKHIACRHSRIRHPISFSDFDRPVPACLFKALEPAVTAHNLSAEKFPRPATKAGLLAAAAL